ncbi:hypothetical protein [Erythrobacter litoralis]|uniref:hypothetical protein n=1 Tax=Erythrobacter litoralis TaxID=39960 RepID=UPI0012DC27BD|nr:hypothetical protein [Erythrobacter litoralis]
MSETANPDQRASNEWENEGGSTGSIAGTALPEGIIAETLVRYRVGSYVYSTLEDAVAQQRRQSLM